MVYTIVVHMYAKADAESISKLKAKLVEASQVYSKDKETLSWYVMQDTKDERKFCIVERYLQESVRYHFIHPHPIPCSRLQSYRESLFLLHAPRIFEDRIDVECCVKMGEDVYWERGRVLI